MKCGAEANWLPCLRNWQVMRTGKNKRASAQSADSSGVLADRLAKLVSGVYVKSCR